jgi:hypothetical protein
MREERSTTMDWSGCDEVEQVEGKVSATLFTSIPVCRLTSCSTTTRWGFQVPRKSEVYEQDVARIKAVIDYSLSHETGVMKTSKQEGESSHEKKEKG